MADRNIQLRQNYDRLRRAGFSSAEATRLRGASEEKISAAIRAQQMPPADPRRVAARTGEKVTAEIVQQYKEKIKVWMEGKVDRPPWGFHKGAIQYDTVTPPLTYDYQSNYTYVVGYKVIYPNGQGEWKVIKITSDERLYKKDLWQKMDEEIFPKKASKYESRVSRGSYHLINAYMRKD